MEVSTLLAYTDGDVWRPGIGDPTVMGWVTVAAYFFAAFLCGRQWLANRVANLRNDMPKDKRLFWGALTLMLVFLGINKQLDLQTWLTLAGRKIAISQGWYENRRVLQAGFVLAIALAGALGTAVAFRLVRRHSDLRVALGGFVILLAFVLTRAASFHHMDMLINFRVGGIRMNWVLEIGAISLLIFGAWKRRTTASEAERDEAEGWVTAR